MKKKIIMLGASLFSVAAAVAQCDQTISYYSGKAEFINNASGNVERSEEGKVVFKVSKSRVALLHNDDDQDTMAGEITNDTCVWKVPFKEGKTSFNTELVDAHGESNAAEVTIEGKDGKTVILVNIKPFGKTLRFITERYEILRQ